MQIRDALSILNLHQHPITLDDIKAAYTKQDLIQSKRLKALKYNVFNSIYFA